MYTVIVGAGKVGLNLAKKLAAEGGEIVLVEQNPTRCEDLSGMLGSIRLVCGDGDEPYVLEEAGVRGADALVAATGHDEDNLVVCLLGKREYRVPMTVARINNPANKWLFTERFGVDHAVCSTEIMVGLLREASEV